MAKGLLALGLMVACMSVGSAQPPQERPQEWAAKTFGPPENLVHDFGNVPRGAMLQHDFVMTNIHAVPIEITSIRPAMGCLTASASKQKLQPNEKATISVSMDARRFTGQKTACIWVTVGPHQFSEVVLTVQAVSRDDIVCNPSQVAFGSVAPGQAPTATIDVEYAGKLAWVVSETVVPKEAPFEVTVKELYRHPGDDAHGEVGYQVKVLLKKDAAPGQFQESIFLKTNDPSAGLLPVWVTGNIQAPLEAVPSALNLKEVKSGASLTRRVFVRSPKPFRVTGIEGPDAVTLALDQPPQPNQVQTVTLEIVPPPQEGPFDYEVKIKTDLQDTPVVVTIDGVVPYR
jgi:Protein of unknown function (DUF1573)